LYQFVGEAVERCAPVQLNNLYGFIDEYGKEIVKPQYDKVESFHKGVAAVWRGEGCGWVDVQGTEIVKCEYDSISLLQNGYAVAKKGNRSFVLDAHGTCVSGCYPKPKTVDSE
jgi:hypothetical protein